MCRSANSPDPQAFFDDILVGGFKELCVLADSGALDKLLTDNAVREL